MISERVLSCHPESFVAVILSPSLAVILSEAKDLVVQLRINSGKDLITGLKIRDPSSRLARNSG